MSAEYNITLPPPQHSSSTPLEEAMLRLKSVRSYVNKSLSLQQVSQLLWAAQGVKNTEGKRTAPSAGGTYPLEIYAVTGNIENIACGIYKYEPYKHILLRKQDGDFRKNLSAAALGQQSIMQAPFAVVIAAVTERTTGKYGQRGVMYTHMEAGHAAQNFGLQAVVLGLGTVVVGAFNDSEVANVLKLPNDEKPLYIIPAGIPVN